MANRLQRLMANTHWAVYKATGGRAGRTMRGAPILFLTTTGRKTGRERVTPLMYIESDGGYVIVASNAGRDNHPSWYHNLRSNPSATILVDGRSVPVRAEVVAPDGTSALWPKLDAIYRGYESYRKKTARVIPLVRLRPA